MNGFGGVDFVLRQELGGREFKDVEAARDFGAVDVAVVPVGRPFAAEDKHLGINGPAVEISNLEWFRGVGEIHDGDAALIPGLHFDVAAGDRNERAVMRHAVGSVGLRGGHFVVVGESQLVVLQAEDGVGAPFVGVVGAAARAQAAAPLIGKDDLVSAVGERSGVPVGIVGIIDGIETLGMHG